MDEELYQEITELRRMLERSEENTQVIRQMLEARMAERQRRRTWLWVVPAAAGGMVAAGKWIAGRPKTVAAFGTAVVVAVAAAGAISHQPDKSGGHQSRPPIAVAPPTATPAPSPSSEPSAGPPVASPSATPTAPAGSDPPTSAPPADPPPTHPPSAEPTPPPTLPPPDAQPVRHCLISTPASAGLRIRLLRVLCVGR